VAFLLLDGLVTHRLRDNVVVSAVDLARRAVETPLPSLRMLPVLFVAAATATGATRTSERRRPRRSAAMLLVLQAVLLTTFLLFGAALHPTASTATLLGTTVIGTAGVATVACRSAVFRLVRRQAWTRSTRLPL